MLARNPTVFLYWVLAGLLCVLSGCPSSGPVEPDVPAVQDSGIDTTPNDSEGTETEDTTDPVTLECKTAPTTAEPFPSAELGVRIMEPTGQRTLLYSGMTVVLGGRAFGPVDTLTVSRGPDDPNPTVISSVAFFWQSGGIALEEGDNHITVTATSQERPNEVATDTIVITAYPSPLNAIGLQAAPDHLFVEESRIVRFTIDVPFGQIDESQVNLYAVDANGVNVAPIDVSKMKDDGVQSGSGACDEIAGDRVYSVCKQLTKIESQSAYFRARLSVPGYGTISTPIMEVPVYERISPAECEAMKTALAQTKAAYDAAADHDAGIQAALSILNPPPDNTPKILEGALSGKAAEGYGVWVRFSGGVLGALSLGVPDDARGTIGSRQARLLRSTEKKNEVEVSADVLNESQCPPFGVAGPDSGIKADVSGLRKLAGYGVIGVAAHGGAFFQGLADKQGWRHIGYQETLWTGEAIDCDTLLEHAVTCQTNSDCPPATHCLAVGGSTESGECIHPNQVDLAAGRVVFNASNYGVVPEFFEHHLAGGLPGSLVYIGACQSAWNGSLAMAMLGNGAASYVGYSGVVSDDFATAVGSQLMTGMVADKSSASQAMCHAMDPAHPGTWSRLIGSSSLSLNNPGIVNSTFELAGLEGWSVDGDGRRMSSFCDSSPPEGKFMGLISTGLGFTDISGSISQTFCIPAGISTLSFSWRYYSAELESTCGLTGFQDTWKVTLTPKGENESVAVLSCSVDDICHYEAGFCLPKPCAPPSDCGCGDCYHGYDPVTACTFDGASVMATNFVQETINISALAGSGPVTLTFTVEDKGQPTNDTAILIDNIKLQ